MPIKDAQERREYQARWVAKRRQEWIDLQGGKCVNCGSTDRLEVDHIDPSTKVCNPREIWNRNEEFRDMELAKCQVLCVACHKAKTVIDKDRMQPHGDARYISKGCRCEICVAAHVEAKRKYRQRKRDAGLPYK